MRNVFLIVCFLIANHLQAQNPFINKDSVQINNAVYLCFPDNDLNDISLCNTQNLSVQQGFTWKRKEIIECSLANINQSVFDNAIATVITSTQRAVFRTHKFGIRCYVKPETGIIQEVIFEFKKTCPISGEQIYALEQALKGKQMYPQPECVPMTFTSVRVDL